MRTRAALAALLLLPLIAWGQSPGIRLPSGTSDGVQKVIISQYLSLDGIGTADSANAIGNYAAAAVDTFYIEPPAGEVWRIARMLVYVEDSGSFDAEKYGNAIVLTNGITVKHVDDAGTITDLTGGLPVLNNGAWGQLCYDAQLFEWGTGNEALAVRWTFQKSGQYVRLVGDDNAKLMVILNDSFVNLLEHRFLVQGYKEAINQ